MPWGRVWGSPGGEGVEEKLLLKDVVSFAVWDGTEVVVELTC